MALEHLILSLSKDEVFRLGRRATKQTTVAERRAALVPAMRVLKPSSPPPWPVALHFHGCGGPHPADHPYALAAVQAGWAVVQVDSFAPRGIGRRLAALAVCTGAALRGPERAGDVLAALAWARAQPWAAADSVVLAGWSHGGWAVMDALALADAPASATGLTDVDPTMLRELAGVVLVYPYAGAISLTHRRGWGEARPRVVVVLAGADRVVGTAGPLRALARLRGDGLEVETLLLPGATHGFDDAQAVDPRTRYRPDLTEQALAFYVAALRRAARP